MAAPDYCDVSPLDGDPYPRGRFHNGQFYGERLVECADSDLEAVLEWFDTAPNGLWPYNVVGW